MLNVTSLKFFIYYQSFYNKPNNKGMCSILDIRLRKLHYENKFLTRFQLSTMFAQYRPSYCVKKKKVFSFKIRGSNSNISQILVC